MRPLLLKSSTAYLEGPDREALDFCDVLDDREGRKCEAENLPTDSQSLRVGVVLPSCLRSTKRCCGTRLLYQTSAVQQYLYACHIVAAQDKCCTPSVDVHSSSPAVWFGAGAIQEDLALQ